MVVNGNDEIRRHKAARLGVTWVTNMVMQMTVGWPVAI